jgi:D-lactate dehydrogenase (cytochrome)
MRAKSAVKQHGGSNFQQATSENEIDSLWAARKEALWAMLAVRPEGTQIWSTDVAVPISQLANMIGLCRRLSSDATADLV